ncbi:type II secretion system protein M [Duganella sp. sic0402]|uniref:type II secretion system protein M n=1 Tax=Duganella sp. sic0402 TaxID=2854786 RepID=UPI001C492430|nr:type II secretion system protein M [Duganella sp. sic0402]MBV7534388.1 type II secretion system protein M [Duganella sp. sic0402]
MKQQWIKLSTKLDAMTLRERVMIFAAALAAMLFLLYMVAVEPLLNKQRLLEMQLKTQQNQITGIELEISAKAQGYVVDPDAGTRAQLKTVQQQIDTTSAGLMAVQKGLVAPNKIAPLLGHLLRGNGKLKLMSMKTLPVTGLNEVVQPEAAQVAAGAIDTVAAVAGVVSPGQASASAQAKPARSAKPRELLYRHGVEVVLQGSYLDMIGYMEALEALPVQLFWGKAQLDAQHYPNSRLTLTLYTLSLDEKWMKL